MNRRDLLSLLGAASPALLIGSHADAQKKSSSAKEIQADVVAVGSGIGGLTAALRAQKLGARVIVLEKAAEPGGTTLHAGGGIDYNTYEEMREIAPDGDPDVQRTVAENVEPWAKFMESIDAPIGRHFSGPSSGRRIAPLMWIKFMIAMIESGGGTILCKTPMIRVLTNHRNEIAGILADSPHGPIRIRTKAVVLATGGWMGNAALVQQHITKHFSGLRQRNTSFVGPSIHNNRPAFLGDGLFAALALGAQPSTGGFDSFYGHLMPARPGIITEPMTALSAYFGPWGVAVNKFGRRFTDESQGKLSGRQMSIVGEELCAQEVARQPDAMAAYICDDFVFKRYAEGGGNYYSFKQSGAPTAMADTLPELARQMQEWGVGMSGESILHDITQYNQAAKDGKTWALPIAKTSARHAIALLRPPFYAILGQAGITATQGGLRVDTLGHVLHRSGKPIPGLFAAGIDIGNFSNCSYLGNLNLGAAYGYVSGANAARQPAPRGGWEIASVT